MWTNNEYLRTVKRRNIFNNAVVLNQDNVVNLVSGMETIWNTQDYPAETSLRVKIRNSILSFRDSISSLTMYPFEIPVSITDDLIVFTNKYSNIKVSELAYGKFYANMGAVEIPKHFHNFADYKGYTYIKVFLPFVGFVDVDVNECIGKWLIFRLVTDFFTGESMYIIGVADNSLVDSSVKYPTSAQDESMRVISTHICRLGVDIPLGTTSFDDVQRNLILGSIKTAGAASLATIAYHNPSTATTVQTTSYDIKTRSKAKGSRLKQTKVGTETTERTVTHHNPANTVKPYSEIFDGSMDILSRNYPSSLGDKSTNSYLNWFLTGEIKVVIYRPKLLDEGLYYGDIYGYPVGEIRKIGSLGFGLIQIGSVYLTSLDPSSTRWKQITITEQSMLKELLLNGVYK